VHNRRVFRHLPFQTGTTGKHDNPIKEPIWPRRR
jgi:hypothetical protein